MHHSCFRLRHMLLAMSLLSWTQVDAASVCISSGNSAALSFWLENYQDNGQNDELRLVEGFYDVPAGGFLFDSSEARSLTISGGWDPGCTTLRGTTNTTLDGGGTDRVMRLLNRNGDLTVRGITFTGGFLAGNASDAAGLNINGGATFGANVTIERNTFSNNFISGNGGAAGLAASTGSGVMRVINNLFVGNDGGNVGAAIVFPYNGPSSAIVTSNTVVGNGFLSTVAGGMRVASTSAPITVSNNVLWANTGGDLLISGVVALFNNDIEVLLGTPDASSAGNFSLAPGFVLGGYRPGAFSPLVNAGLNTPPGGLLATDLDGYVRIQGPAVDIGVYETSVLFADGFD